MNELNTIFFDSWKDWKTDFSTTKKTTSTFPKMNNKVFDDETQILEFAVAGYLRENISVEQKENFLFISGEQDPEKMKNSLYPDTKFVVYANEIACRKFSLRFRLGQHQVVKTVCLQNGILTIVLKTERPESEKPKKFVIE